MTRLLTIFLFPTFLCFTLTSCDDTPSVQDFLDDPELLQKTTKQCIEQVLTNEVYDKETCENAKEAQIQKTKNALDLILK